MMPQLVDHYLKRDKDGLLSLLSRSITKVSVIVLPAMVLLVLISQDLMVVLFSASYASAGIVFAVYSLTLFQRVVDYSAVLRAINRTGAVTRWAAVTAVLNLVLSVPFVLWLGMVGAAVATLIATAASWIYILVITGWVLRVPFRRVFPFAFYGRALAVAALSAVPAVLLDGWVEIASGWTIAAKSVLYLATYVALSTISGVCTRRDWEFVAGLVGLGQTSR
jgi:O-antigen/teichoic acid export membrane protein